MLLAISQSAVWSVVLVCLHSVALICLMTSDHASRCRSNNAVMTGIVAGYTTHGSTFETSLRVSLRNGKDEYKSCAARKNFHFSLQFIHSLFSAGRNLG
jgi:fluoride ion exporter CrcB/FEX